MFCNLKNALNWYRKQACSTDTLALKKPIHIFSSKIERGFAMNGIQIFNNEEFGQIRLVLINNEPWIVGKDVAQALGYENTKDALNRHVEAEDKQIIQRSQITTLEIPNRGMTIINESGMYALIFGSKLPSARRFKHWVTSEVLPTIRKTGRYSPNTYRIQDAPLSKVTALLHEASSFLREMDKVMRDQNSHPSDIAEEFKSVCSQLGIVKLSDNFVKVPYVYETEFFPLSVIEGCEED